MRDSRFFVLKGLRQMLNPFPHFAQTDTTGSSTGKGLIKLEVSRVDTITNAFDRLIEKNGGYDHVAVEDLRRMRDLLVRVSGI